MKPLQNPVIKEPHSTYSYCYYIITNYCYVWCYYTNIAIAIITIVIAKTPL